MARYAIISDIHGNLTALNAVLENIKKQNIDKIICLGDTISKGSHSHECLNIIREKCDVVLQGNNDLEYTKSLDEIASLDGEDFDYEAFYFNQKQLTNEDIDYLKKLPYCCEFKLSGLLVRCYHASPVDLYKIVVEYSSLPDKLLQFAPTKFTTPEVADVVVFGHTHSSSLECLFGRRLINAGSVGNPSAYVMKDEYNNANKSLATMAQYIILEGDEDKESGEFKQEFICLKYDIENEIKDFKFDKEKACYLKELKQGVYRHQDRINKRLVELGSKIDEI